MNEKAGEPPAFSTILFNVIGRRVRPCRSCLGPRRANRPRRTHGRCGERRRRLPAPTVVVSPPEPTTSKDPTCGTKIRLRLESAATEWEFCDCGIFSISTLVPSMTPSAAPPAGDGQPLALPQALLEPV